MLVCLKELNDTLPERWCIIEHGFVKFLKSSCEQPAIETGRFQILESGVLVAALRHDHARFLISNNQCWEIANVKCLDETRSFFWWCLGVLRIRQPRIFLHVETVLGDNLVLVDNGFHQTKGLDSIDYEEFDAHIFYWIDIFCEAKSIEEMYNFTE